MSQYELSDEATPDLNEIWDYLAQENLDAADRMLNRLYEQFQRVGSGPFRYPVHRELAPLRCSVVSPYVIFYEPDETQARTVRVLHGRRNLRETVHGEPS